jgi:hypothetical protein
VWQNYDLLQSVMAQGRLEKKLQANNFNTQKNRFISDG